MPFRDPPQGSLSSSGQPGYSYLYGQPIRGRDDECYPSALFEGPMCTGPNLLTVREYTMMEIMNSISDKIDWHIKVFDEKFIAVWRTEILTQPEIDVSERMFEQSILELQYKANIYKDLKYVEALDGVFKSDTMIHEDLRLALIDAVKLLENVAEDQRDWHPGSDGKVLDLVHPSLYPLVYGQSRPLALGSTTSLDDWRCQYGLGDISGDQHPSKFWIEEVDGDEKWSTKFQWLPCDVDVSGGECKIISYINNLHPQKHFALYSIIEELIQRSIVLWDITLSALQTRSSRTPRITKKAIGDGYGESTEPEPVYPIDGGDKELDDHWEQSKAWRESRPILQPEPKPFEPPKPTIDFHDIKLRDWGRLQVIVKLATIHLTPSSPTYGGGSWHVEGAANEMICASAIYYYQSANISESLLSFQRRVNTETYEDMDYEPGDHRAYETIYGFENGEEGTQYLGDVRTPQGRLLAFPNVLQHSVGPFALEDLTKPGYRKILALFLVDPHQRIISTANVAPQQAEWWEEHLKLKEQALGKLPQELRDAVEEYFPPMMTLEEAKGHREDLMDERTMFTEVQDELIGRDTFNLCEH